MEQMLAAPTMSDPVVPSAPQSHALPHMPQLDGLRALAVAGVVVHHNSLWGDLGILATVGVKLFFVLSGFLITGILLRSRDNAQKLNISWSATVGRFYARRMLRIFPLYYFVIAVALAVNLEPTREILVWLLTYTLNIHMAEQGWYVENFAHFWTLSVEEQFYVVWPWLVLLGPRKWLIPLTLVFIAAGPGYRLYGLINEVNGIATYIFTLASVDSLGMGALLALFWRRFCSQEAILRGSARIALLIGAPAAVLLHLLARFDFHWEYHFIFFDLALSLFFFWLIHSAAIGFGGPAGWVLSWAPVTYVGKISYGIYVYHEFVPLLCRWFARRLGISYADGTWMQFILTVVVTLLISSLSWHLLEKPINGLKRYFDDSVTSAPPRDTKTIVVQGQSLQV